MMNKKGYLLIGLIYSLFITNIMSQELKTPTLEDLIPGGETYRYAENLYSLQWWPSLSWAASDPSAPA